MFGGFRLPIIVGRLPFPPSATKKGEVASPLRFIHFSISYPSGVFGIKVQIPQGQAPAQKPQPMHFSLSQTMANSLSGKA